MSSHPRERNPERRGARGRYRAAAAALAIGAHLVILFLMIRALPTPPTLREPDAVTVTLVAMPHTPTAPLVVSPPRPTPARAAASSAARAVLAPRRSAAASAPRQSLRPTPAPLSAGPVAAMAPAAGLTEAQLAGAATAGSGSGEGREGAGRACDMVRRLQAALRRDAHVQAAVAEAHRAQPRAILVWNGDWIRSPGQDGKGLAGVRQAIALEVAFAPEACRAEPVHGLVLISLADAPGSARLVLGGGVWRWSDLLYAR